MSYLDVSCYLHKTESVHVEESNGMYLHDFAVGVGAYQDH